jgi:Flp pilus assembly pilin Flp
MKKFIQNNKKGFTLIELILILGLITLAIIAIYTVYNKKRTETLVKNQAIYLAQLSQGINGAFSSTTNFTLLTPANVIATRVVPTPMVESPTIIRNLFGGTVSFSGTNGTPPIFTITLDTVPKEACALLATTGFADNSRQVTINGTAIKTAGAVINSNSVGTAVSLCVNNQNTLDFTNFINQPSEIEAVDASSNRAKEDPFYIATPGITAISPAVSCVGGTSWNGSFCGCAAGSEWDGHTCVAYNSKPGACPIGQGWNGSACVTHSVSGPGGTYLGGRNLPNLGYTAAQVQKTNPGAACYAAGGYYDGITCQTCKNGAWNGFRCVTP